ncbi:ABC transporter permease [Ructibacterium gallinarum]|uniref:ABC transporter permease n=1 Tax=Ructibacterium gallinarum TaxID=2779355 RepID=UPI001CF8F86D|nr:ABC transporter permease subunit [Ructibacterium gallinarum]
MKSKTKQTVIKNKRISAEKIKSQLPLFMMTLPGIIITFMFAYMPMFGIILAFKKINLRQGIFGSDWYGLKNFSYLFKSNDAYIMIRNTICYNLTFIVVGAVLGVALAIGLSILRNKRTSKVFQTVFIMPHFLSMIIVSYLVLAFLNMENGFLNRVITMVFGGDPVNWYVEPKWWPFILIFVNFWKEMGFGSIIYLSAISGIDMQLYEAASIDGASGWQKIWHITLPMLKTIVCIQIILGVGSLFGGDFGLFYQVPMDSGALSEVTTTIPVYVYKNITAGGPRALGLASATSFIQSVTGCALVIFANAVVRKLDSDSSLF